MRQVPFSHFLPVEWIDRLLEKHGIRYRKRVFDPATTLWCWLSQVLSEDQSLRQAVLLLQATGLSQMSSLTNGYNKARKRASLDVISDLVKATGRHLHDLHEPMIAGRNVQIVDGSTITMMDTADNQETYPQPTSQEPGLGFPSARIVALFSASSGVVVDFAMGRLTGKGTGETALFRRLMTSVPAGEIVLGDKYFDSYWNAAMLNRRGVDIVCRMRETRRDQGEEIVTWERPFRPDWMSKSLHSQLPPRLRLRIVRKQMGRRVIKLITTLCDRRLYRAEELLELYRHRWDVELDLRSLKEVMAMEPVQCKTPEMVQKDVWMHLFGYNTVRKMMAIAAVAGRCETREISFKGTLQAIRTAAPQVNGQADCVEFFNLGYNIQKHRVRNRPGRTEPRAVKRRPKKYARLQVPRGEAKLGLVDGR